MRTTLALAALSTLLLSTTAGLAVVNVDCRSNDAARHRHGRIGHPKLTWYFHSLGSIVKLRV